MQRVDETMTTAEGIAAYYDELLERGMSARLVEQLVLSAARYLHDGDGIGLTVKAKRS